MKCRVCGAPMRKDVTDLPFKLNHRSIVIVKGLPVLLCQNCMEYALEDRVVATVDHILGSADDAAELHVVKYAA